MDVLYSEEYYEEIFKFKDTSPLSQKFAINGIEDKNFINNSGSYLSMLILLFLLTILLFIINKIATCCFKYNIARRIGIWAYEKCYYDHLEQQCCKLILESYFDVSICSFINLLAFMESRNAMEFYEFFRTYDDIMCSIIVLVHILLVILLPIFCHYIQKNACGTVYDFEEEKSPWLPIIQEDIRQDNLVSSLYTVIFLYRRLVTSIVLVFLVKTPLFQ